MAILAFAPCASMQHGLNQRTPSTNPHLLAASVSPWALACSIIFISLLENYSKENPAGPVLFMGPPSKVMDKISLKLDARALAKENNVPVFDGSETITDVASAKKIAKKIGYPVMLKLNAGGGGKGMTPIFSEEEIENAIESTQRIGKNLYGDDSYYFEKLIQNPVHIEVQIFNSHGIGIRKCAIQRRNQKIVEESGAAFLDLQKQTEFIKAAEKMALASGYNEDGGAGLGTVEFLFDLCPLW